MNQALLLSALLVPLFSSGLRADPPRRFTASTLREESQVAAEIESIVRDESLPKFVNYPLHASMLEWIREHRTGNSWAFQRLYPAASVRAKESDAGSDHGLLLMITTFCSDNTSEVRRHVVGASGLAGSWEEVFDHAIRGARPEALPAARFLRLLAALRDLPDANEYPPLEQLAIVSFRQDDEWITRTLKLATVQDIVSLLDVTRAATSPRHDPRLTAPALPSVIK